MTVKHALLCALGVAFLGSCGGESKPASAPPSPSPQRAAQRADSTPAPEQTGECPDGMVAISGGTLWMGSAAGRGRDDERPQHKREIAGFCLDQREVTIGDYTACVKNGICDAAPREVQLLAPARQHEHEARSRSCTAQLAEHSSLPVNCVELDDASKYCAWKGRRLPSEAEWEWAATGGDDKLDYPWGASPPRDDVACFQAKRPCTVGSKPAEAFGLFDLAGNVAEWTSSAYGPYPATPESGDKHSIRGGSFLESDAEALRPRRRASADPMFRDITLGFRCAKDL